MPAHFPPGNNILRMHVRRGWNFVSLFLLYELCLTTTGGGWEWGRHVHRQTLERHTPSRKTRTDSVQRLCWLFLKNNYRKYLKNLLLLKIFLAPSTTCSTLRFSMVSRGRQNHWSCLKLLLLLLLWRPEKGKKNFCSPSFSPFFSATLWVCVAKRKVYESPPPGLKKKKREEGGRRDK